MARGRRPALGLSPIVSVSPYDHFRAGDDAAVPAGVYRVVGVDDERVTLLRVGDETAERVHTGQVERVARADLDGFEAAGSPDRTGPVAAVRGALDGLWLTARFAPRRAATRPLQTGGGVLFPLVASAGPVVVPATPDPAFAVAEGLGVALLAAVAAGVPRGR